MACSSLGARLWADFVAFRRFCIGELRCLGADQELVDQFVVGSDQILSIRVSHETKSESSVKGQHDLDLLLVPGATMRGLEMDIDSVFSLTLFVHDVTPSFSDIEHVYTDRLWH